MLAMLGLRQLACEICFKPFEGPLVNLHYVTLRKKWVAQLIPPAVFVKTIVERAQHALEIGPSHAHLSCAIRATFQTSPAIRHHRSKLTASIV